MSTDDEPNQNVHTPTVFDLAKGTYAKVAKGGDEAARFHYSDGHSGDVVAACRACAAD